MNLVFVHGWSVTHTNTYGQLHRALSVAAPAYNLDINVQHIHLGKYISFHDEVTLDDIARAFDRALRDLPGNGNRIRQFSAITHSTGGPVVRYWLDKFYGARKLAEAPLKHLVMLAPANHGSALAILGKQRVGRLKAWFSGVEPGQGVLDWLCLGSTGQWQLNENWLAYNCPKHNVYPFVLTGQGIDTAFYDFLNSYLVEPGSDGVVRASGANLNYRYLALEQGSEVLRKKPLKTRLVANRNRPVKMSKGVPIGIFAGYSHSGDKMGVMRSPRPSKNDIHPVVSEILACLKVNSAGQYEQRYGELEQLTTGEQALVPAGKKDRVSRFAMLVFNVHDQHGNPFRENDYGVVLLGGPAYNPAQLPKGFMVDKQMNRLTGNLVYYIDADRMQGINKALFGLRVVARPTSGFAWFNEGEFHSEGLAVDKVFSPNETTYLDITMQRHIDQNVFRLRRSDKGHENFRKIKPSGKSIDD